MAFYETPKHIREAVKRYDRHLDLVFDNRDWCFKLVYDEDFGGRHSKNVWAFIDEYGKPIPFISLSESMVLNQIRKMDDANFSREENKNRRWDVMINQWKELKRRDYLNSIPTFAQNFKEHDYMFGQTNVRVQGLRK